MVFIYVSEVISYISIVKIISHCFDYEVIEFRVVAYEPSLDEVSIFSIKTYLQHRTMVFCVISNE